MSLARHIATAVWAIAHSATYGYHIGSLNGVQDAVVCNGSEKSGPWDCLDISDNQFGFAVTVFTLGGLAGSLAADSVSRRFDRVGTLRMSEIGFMIGALVVAASTQLWMIVLGRYDFESNDTNRRFIIGFAAGLVLVTVPPLLAQIAPERYRTFFGTMHQSSIGIGMLIAQSLSLVFAKRVLWRFELLTAVGIAAVLLGLSFFAKDDVDEPASGPGESTALLGDEGHKTHQLSVKELFGSSDSALKSGFLIVCVAQCAQQICGISPVVYFSSRILQPVFGGDSKLVVLGIMGVGIPFNFLPGVLPSSLGSKRILMISALGTALCTLLLGIGLNTHNQALSGTSVIAFIIAFSIGLAPIAWVVLSEVIPPEARTAVGSVAVGINWTTNFCAGSSFLPLQQYLSHGSHGEGNIMFVFSVASLLACVAIWGSFHLYERSKK